MSDGVSRGSLLRAYQDLSTPLGFSPVAQGSATAGVDSVTTSTGVSMWQSNDNTVNQGNLTWPLQKASGKNIYRFEDRPGDKRYAADDASLKTGTMLVNSNHPDSFSTNYDMSFSFLLERGYAFSPTFMSILEWQGSPDANGVNGGNGTDNNNAWPPFFIQLFDNGGDLQFSVGFRTSNAINVIAEPGLSIIGRTSIQRDTRNHLYIRNKWNSSSGGSHTVILNGQTMFSYSGATGYNDAVGPWFALGLYHSRAPTGTNVALQVANLEYGTSDLSGRVASPLAW